MSIDEEGGARVPIRTMDPVHISDKDRGDEAREHRWFHRGQCEGRAAQDDGEGYAYAGMIMNTMGKPLLMSGAMWFGILLCSTAWAIGFKWFLSLRIGV